MIKKKYCILSVLRGLSALFVLFYHFFIYFFVSQEASAKLLQIEPVDLLEPFYLQAIKDFPIDIGHLGVAFFFLISGFLILPSLERYVSLKVFLVHKLFRLWPSYAVCFSSGLLFVALFYLLRTSAFPYEPGHILSYFFWVRDLFHYPFIDGAVWSLEVQIKFYLLAGIVWSLGKKNFLEKMCFLTLLTSFVVYGLYSWLDDELSWFYLIILARRNLKYFILILLGTCIYALDKKQISWPKAVGLCSLLLACFVSPLFSSPDIAKTTSYLFGFFAFSYFILFHPQSTRAEGLHHKLIHWVSNISYPLYIGHVLPGYVIMYFMIDHGLSVYLGIFIAFFYVFLMAEVVHKKIESVFSNKSLKTFFSSQKNQLYLYHK